MLHPGRIVCDCHILQKMDNGCAAPWPRCVWCVQKLDSCVQVGTCMYFVDSYTTELAHALNLQSGTKTGPSVLDRTLPLHDNKVVNTFSGTSRNTGSVNTAAKTHTIHNTTHNTCTLPTSTRWAPSTHSTPYSVNTSILFKSSRKHIGRNDRHCLPLLLV